MTQDEVNRRIQENFDYIDAVLERDLGIDLHPSEPVYENTETAEELAEWIEEQVYGPDEEKWNDQIAEGVELIPIDACRDMMEHGEFHLEEDGEGFEDQTLQRIKTDLWDKLDKAGYYIASKNGKEETITRYTLGGWYSLRPDEFDYYGGGVEWDYVSYAYWFMHHDYERLKKHAFLVLHIDENGPVSYPFFIYKVGDKWHHHESAFKDNIVDEEFASSAEAVEVIMTRWKNAHPYENGITQIKEYVPWDQYEKKFDDFYIGVYDDYRNWLKKYAPDFYTESSILDAKLRKMRVLRNAEMTAFGEAAAADDSWWMAEDRQYIDMAAYHDNQKRAGEKPLSEAGDKVNKNGVNRKNLYIAFIQYARRVDKANKFDTNFTKDIFDTKYKNVPDSMRYFYRLADPTQCIINDGLVFFSLKNAQEVNKKNSDITKYYIFAGVGDFFYVVNQKTGAVHQATEAQLRHVRAGKKMADNFDQYIQKLVNNGNYLDGSVVPPEDRPEEEEKKQ